MVTFHVWTFPKLLPSKKQVHGGIVLNNQLSCLGILTETQKFIKELMIQSGEKLLI